MTHPASSFAEAKRLLAHCKEATRLEQGIDAGGDRMYVRFRMPLYDQSTPASNYLLFCAIQCEFGSGSYGIDGDDAIISLPVTAVGDKIPVHRLEQGLHRVRKALLSALEQQSDGTYIINKKRMNIAGAAHIDLEDLAHALVTNYDERCVKAPDHRIEPRYELPKDTVYIDDAMNRHTGEVSQETYAKYMSEKQQSGSLYVPFDQAETQLTIDGHVLNAIYREMGINTTPTLTH